MLVKSILVSFAVYSGYSKTEYNSCTLVILGFLIFFYHFGIKNKAEKSTARCLYLAGFISGVPYTQL